MAATNRRRMRDVQPGEQLHDWLVLDAGPHLRSDAGHSALFCRCTGCGQEQLVDKRRALAGSSRRCRRCAAKLAAKPIEIGQSFGSWVVLEVGPHLRTAARQLAVRCRCEHCGTEHLVNKSNLSGGRSTKCQSCSPRQSRLADPRNTNSMVVAGATERLPKLSAEQLSELLTAALAERDRRELDW